MILALRWKIRVIKRKKLLVPASRIIPHSDFTFNVLPGDGGDHAAQPKVYGRYISA